ncbi:hybrid sensor histidine kinase/response regulator [Oscillatoriales cyanobacterium USR001]|nr:hybrid sensor histidine kinase/response regulator [Oscillatoriales cyanobacterium USR001]
MLPEQQQRIMGYFIEEAKDHLNTIEQGLLNLQSTIEDAELVNEVFRAAHSVKGGAAMLGLSSIQQTAHRLEDSFKVLKECEGIQVDQKLESFFLRVFDTMKALIEQLSSPFGLTEETADMMLSEVEPVFEELNKHLAEIVKKSGGVWEATALHEPEKEMVVAGVTGKSRNLSVAAVGGQKKQKRAKEESALGLIFRSDVTEQMRLMLQAFKQPESTQSRQELYKICRVFKAASSQFELQNWVELIAIVERAIANPENTYRTLAPIVIKNIKQAQELVIAGRETEIVPGENLIALLPPEPDLETSDSELEDLLAFTEDAPEGETTDTGIWNLDGVELNVEELETESETANEYGIDNSTDLDEIFQKVESSSTNFEWGDAGGGYQQTMIQFDDGTVFGAPDQETVSFKGSHRTGPEVGIAELNTLADLFEGETPELEGAWEEAEEIPEITNGAQIGLPNVEEDNSSDFTDLLFDAQEIGQGLNSNAEEDLANLFGGDFMLPEESRETEKISPAIAAQNETSRVNNQALIDDSDLSDLLGIAESSEADNNTLELEFTDGELTDNTLATMSPNLDLDSESMYGHGTALSLPESLDLPSGSEAESLDLNVESEDLEALFGDLSALSEAEESITMDNIESAGEDSDFDQLFGAENELNDNGETESVTNWLNLASANISELPSLDPLEENIDLSEWEGLEITESVAIESSNNESEEDGLQSFLDEMELVAAGENVEEETENFENPETMDFALDLEMENELEELSAIDVDDNEEILAAPDWLDTEMDALEELTTLESTDIAGELTNSQLSHRPETESLNDLLDSQDAQAWMNAEEEINSYSSAESIVLANDEENDDDFADLEAMLDIEDSDSNNILLSDSSETKESDVFSELEDLLIEPEAQTAVEETPPTPSKVTVVAETGEDNEDEFGDLGSLLLDHPKGQNGSRETAVAQGNRNTARPNRRSFEQTMRVPVKQLDNLSNLMGELVVNRNSLEQDQERMRQFLDNLLHQVSLLSEVGARMQDLYERSLLEISLLATRQAHRNTWHSEPSQNNDHSSSNRFGFSDIELDRFTPFHSQSQEIIELIVRVRESAADIEFLVDEADQVTRQLRQVTTQLQEGLTRARMMPFAQTADRLPRAVRDISIKCGKQAQLIVEGKDTLIDKMILEQLYDPMTHLVNNAITHGIETPDVRSAAKKPAVGKITIRVFHQGNQTVISVSDDGAGIDPQKVKAKAIKQGLVTAAQAQKMSRSDVYDLLFMPGFSTQETATEFAGRGVGMDVVRTSLSEIRGSITIDSTIGKGTVFTIRLPLTLSISKALCCISDRARIAFPMDGVEDMIDVPREQVQVGADGQHSIEWRGSMLPFRHLRELLGYNRYLGRGSVYGFNSDDDMISVIVLRTAGTFLAVQVDQVSTEQEIVIKQLEGPVPKPVGIAGATVLGDGRIVAIADVLELIDLATGRLSKEAGGAFWDENSATPPAEAPPDKNEPTVLIVDDSITVRSLLSITFEKAGYRVEEARDGKEAWEKLKSGLPCDIVFCDIEMPRMDGLELLSRMQKDSTLCELPIAMLTSRGADRHRQMAYSLGARGYFTKPYLEEHLLDAASRMLKGEIVGAPVAAGA